MTPDAELLATSPLFAPLEADERAALVALAAPVRHPAGTALFAEGDPGDALYIVRSGSVELRLAIGGEHLLLETAGPGGVFGELALLDPGPRTATALVTQDLDALLIGRAQLEQFLSAHPRAALALLGIMARRLRATDARLVPTAPGVPRWPALLAIVALALLFFSLPDRYTIGPRWAIPAALVALIIPLYWARLAGYHRLTHVLARGTAVVLTLAVASSAILLLVQLTKGRTDSLALLRDAGLIWGANILTFALWYWELDGGGPAMRRPGRHASADFAFPQQQQDDDGLVLGWSPGFLDYLFLAFNTSTAFSPTDTLVLSRRMKLLMMLQALISLIVVAVLAARAINTLGG